MNREDLPDFIKRFRYKFRYEQYNRYLDVYCHVNFGVDETHVVMAFRNHKKEWELCSGSSFRRDGEDVNRTFALKAAFKRAMNSLINTLRGKIHPEHLEALQASLWQQFLEKVIYGNP